MNTNHSAICALLLASSLGSVPLGRAGTVTVEGDQVVTGHQTIQSNQTVVGTMDVQGLAAQIAGTRLRSLGPAGQGRWIRVAQIGTNALFSGRVLAEGGGADYVADFAFPAVPPSGSYAALLVEMGAATNFQWEVRTDGGSNHVWFLQPAGSAFANFLFSQEGCTEDWTGPGGSPTGELRWSSASGARGVVRAGGVTLRGAGLTLADGTVLSSGTNITAAALADGTNILLSASGGRLAFSGPSDFSGAVTLPEIVALGTNGVTLSAGQWDRVDSSFQDGATWSQKLIGNLGGSIKGMVADTNGNQFVFGGFAGTMAVGSSTIQSGTANADADLAGFIVKFSADGAPLWAKSFPLTNHVANGTAGEWLVEIGTAKTDNAGNIYFGGTFRASATFGGVTRTPNGGGDGFVASLSANGSFRWFRQFGAELAPADSIVDIDVDPAGTNVGAGGTMHGYASGLDWNGNEYVGVSYEDANGYAVKLNGSGATVGEWSLGGHPAEGETWAFGHEYSGEGSVSYWATSVSHIRVAGDGVVVRWTADGEETLRKLGGSGEWAAGCSPGFRDIKADASGRVFVVRDQFYFPELLMWGPSQLTCLGSDGSENWTRYGVFDPGSWGDKTIVDVVVDPQGNSLIAWHEEFYDGDPPTEATRRFVDRFDASGNAVWTNLSITGIGEIQRVLADGRGEFHVLGPTSHARLAGTSNAVQAITATPPPAGTLLAVSAYGDSLAMACGGPPPVYIHSDPLATSIGLGGVINAGPGGIRLADGSVLASVADIASAGGWQPGSSAGSYWMAGNIGLGTANPQARLDVVGDARFSGGATIGGSLSVASGSVVLGSNGTVLSGQRWGALDSSLQLGGDIRTLAASGFASVKGMVADVGGNRYLFGAFAGTMNLGGGIVLSSATTENDRAGFVLKLDPLGYLLWAQAFDVGGHTPNGQQNEMLVDITCGRLDRAGNLVLGGAFRRQARFAGYYYTPQGPGDAFVVCLKPDGGRLWFKQYSGGSTTASDAINDLRVSPSGTNIVAGGVWAKSGGDTDGLVLKLNAQNGNTLTNWTLTGNPGDTNASDVASSVLWVGFSGDSPVAAWQGGGGQSVRKLGSPAWWYPLTSTTKGMWCDSAGAVFVLEEGSDSLGRLTKLAGQDGTEAWIAQGSYTYNEEQPPLSGYNWQSIALRDVLIDSNGDAVCVASDTGYYYYYYDEYSYGEGSWDFLKVQRLSSDQGSEAWVWQAADSSGVRLGLDQDANLHVVNGANHIRFAGTSSTVAESSTISTSAGALVDFVSSPEALTLAYNGPPPAVVQNTPWDMTMAVDGYLSVGQGLRLGDGTYLNSAGDIVGLGPLQTGTVASTYFLAGNFGIGTNSPGAKLDVAGDARVSGSFNIGDDLVVIGSVQGAGGEFSNLSVDGSLTVSGDITAGGIFRAGTGSVQLTDASGRLRREALAAGPLYVQPAGDISMGGFTNGPAQ